MLTISKRSWSKVIQAVYGTTKLVLGAVEARLASKLQQQCHHDSGSASDLAGRHWIRVPSKACIPQIKLWMWYECRRNNVVCPFLFPKASARKRVNIFSTFKLFRMNIISKWNKALEVYPFRLSHPALFSVSGLLEVPDREPCLAMPTKIKGKTHLWKSFTASHLL